MSGHRKVVWVLCVSLFSSMLGIGIIIPLLPIYAAELGAQGLWIGLIFSGFSISRSIFTPFVGRASDLKGRKPFIATGMFLYWAISLGYLFSDSVLDLLAVRLLQGLSASMILPVVMAYIGEVSPMSEEGRYIGFLNTALFAGFGFGPLIGGFVMQHFGMEVDFYLMSLLCLLAFILVAALLPESRVKVGSKTKSFFKAYLEILRSRLTRGLFFLRYSNSFVRGALITFLPLYAHSRLGLSSLEIGVAISANILLTSFLHTPFGRLADLISRRSLVVVGHTSFSLLVGAFPFIHSFEGVFIVSLFIGIFGALMIPAATALAVEEGRTFGMGLSLGVFNMAMSLGLASGPILAGILTDLVNLNSAFFFCSTVGLMGTFTFLMARR